MRLASFLALIAGSVVAYAILQTIGFAIGPVVMALPMAKESVAGRMEGWVHGVWLGFGILAPVVGGYLAAHIAKVQPLLHSALVGIFGSVLFVLMSKNTLLMTVYAVSLYFPSAIVGGLYWKRHHSRNGRAL